MHRSIEFAVATALAVASGLAAAEVEPNQCHTDVSRDRDVKEMSCQQQFGPLSGQWLPSDTTQLDTCLEQVIFEFKVKRWLCDGVRLTGVDYGSF